MRQTSKWTGYSSRRPISLKNKSNKDLIKCSVGVYDVHSQFMLQEENKCISPEYICFGSQAWSRFTWQLSCTAFDSLVAVTWLCITTHFIMLWEMYKFIHVQNISWHACMSWRTWMDYVSHNYAMKCCPAPTLHIASSTGTAYFKSALNQEPNFILQRSH